MEQSGAKVVLSSSWKKAWSAGCTFDCTFKEAGITIYDTTPPLRLKATEIAAWLKAHPTVDGFVILDDARFGWGELDSYVIKTDPENARGLEKEHIALAVAVIEKRYN